MKKTLIQQKKVLNQIIELLDTKKAQRIEVYDLSNKNAYTDFVIIASTTSSTHNRALIKYIQELFKDLDVPTHQGLKSDPNPSWNLIDGYWFIIHLFYGEDRENYNLEGLCQKIQSRDKSLGE